MPLDPEIFGSTKTALDPDIFGAAEKPMEITVNGVAGPDEAAKVAASEGKPAEGWKGSTLGSIVRGVRDIPDGGAQLLTRGLEAIAPAGSGFEKFMQGQRQHVEGINKKAEDEYKNEWRPDLKDEMDFGRMGGNVLATLPFGGATGGGLAARTAANAVQGGAMATLQPVQEGQDFWSEKAKQAGAGAVGGAIATPVTAALGRVIQPNTSQAVKTLMAEGVTPTPGQIMGGGMNRMEEKLTSVPLIGDAIRSSRSKALDEFNRAAYNRALSPIGASAEKGLVGREGVEAVKNKLGSAYDEVLSRPNMRLDFDQQTGQGLQSVQSMLKQAHPEQADVYKRLMNTAFYSKLTPAGTMSGETFKAAESELGRLARGLQGDASFEKRELGNALLESQRLIRDGLARSAGSTNAADLQAVNKGYSNFTTLRNASGRQGAEERFTPSQLSAAVRAGDKSAGKGQFATGNARMQDLSDAGRQVLGDKVPNSGTADRAMAAGGVGLAAYLADPRLLAGVGIGSLPYLPIGRQAAAAAMTKRPQSAAEIAELVRKSAPSAGLLSPALYDLLNK